LGRQNEKFQQERDLRKKKKKNDKFTSHPSTFFQLMQVQPEGNLIFTVS
jgi:hypothetical protein